LLFSAIRASAECGVNLELFLMHLGAVMQRGFNTGKIEAI